MCPGFLPGFSWVETSTIFCHYACTILQRCQCCKCKKLYFSNMKISPKTRTLNGLILVTLAIAAGGLVAKPGNHGHMHGTDILHLSIRENMSNEGVVSNA